MTQQISNEQMGIAVQRRGRGPTKPFPVIEFEEALLLPKGILEYGVNGEIQRLTLMGQLNLSPSSSKTRQLITNSTKYGLTSGGNSAPTLAITSDGQVVLGSDRSSQATKEKQFELAIARFDPFNNIYERLKEQRLPDEAVLKDELSRAGIPDTDRQKAVEVFTANLRYVGLIESISGNDHVRSIEQIVQQMPRSVPDSSHKPHGADLPVETPAPVAAPGEENGKITQRTNRPALHIDIQVHIDPTSSAEQIDQIFASMAKHLYGNES